MKKIAFIILAMLLPFISTEAKVGKIKYGKNIIYEGEILNNAPNGQGNLIITDIKNKDITFISVNGTFEDKRIKDATLNASDFNALEFEGNMSFEPKGEKGKSMEIILSLGKGTLYHDDIEYMYKRVRNITITDELQINVSTSKQAKEWTIRFGQNAAQNANFKALVPNMPLPRNVDLLGYSTDKMTGFEAAFSINEVLVNCSEEGRYIFEDGAYFQKDEMHFPNEDVIRLTNNDWTGSMTYADGTHINKDHADLFKIEFQNGDTYVGTLKRTSLQDLARRSTDRPNFKYKTGTYTSNGQEEKWIAGESFTQRHKRLSEIMRPELVKAVEEDQMTEQEGVKREKELKAEEERMALDLAAHRLEFSDDSISANNALYPTIMHAIKGKKFSGKVALKNSEYAKYSKKIQLWLTITMVSSTRCLLNYRGKLMVKDNEAAEYFSTLEPTFVNEGNYAYHIEENVIYIYDTMNFERQPFSFTLNKNMLNCEELSGLLNLAR